MFVCMFIEIQIRVCVYVCVYTTQKFPQSPYPSIYNHCADFYYTIFACFEHLIDKTIEYVFFVFNVFVSLGCF